MLSILRQIINSVCLCHSMCLSVSTFTVVFLDRFSWHRGNNPKSRNEFVGGQHHTMHSVPYFVPRQKTRPFGPKDPENPCKYKYANFCLKCSRIAGISASYRKLGSRNTMVYRPPFTDEGQIWCARADPSPKGGIYVERKRGRKGGEVGKEV